MEKVIEVKNLSTTFKGGIEKVKAIDGVSFSVNRGEMLGIVGESGCGKSVTSQSVMRLYDEETEAEYSGEVLFDGKDLMRIPYRDMESVRGNKIAMIFQDALSSLNPVYTVGNQLIETMQIHQNLGKKEAWEKAVWMLEKVGISDPVKRMKQYPHELSGGMRQRVMIAIALSCTPELLIADEPTTALDVTIQAQIMELISGLKKKEDMGVILITHDMAVVAQDCDRVIVMYLGEMVEEADVTEIFDHPGHPYTVGLMKSIPGMDSDRNRELYMIEGTLPLLGEVGCGCRFAARCPYAKERCHMEEPEIRELSEGHMVRCFYPAGKEEGKQIGEQ